MLPPFCSSPTLSVQLDLFLIIITSNYEHWPRRVVKSMDYHFKPPASWGRELTQWIHDRRSQVNQTLWVDRTSLPECIGYVVIFGGQLILRSVRHGYNVRFLTVPLDSTPVREAMKFSEYPCKYHPTRWTLEQWAFYQKHSLRGPYKALTNTWGPVRWTWDAAWMKPMGQIIMCNEFTLHSESTVLFHFASLPFFPLIASISSP
jgi:hypothetical protein